MAKYRKKPVVVEAEIYKPGMEDGFKCHDVPGICCNRDYCILPNRNKASAGCQYSIPFIKTLEGEMLILPGDYIITGVKGERYPCKADIFYMTYEPVGGGVDEAKQNLRLPALQQDPSGGAAAGDDKVQAVRRVCGVMI